mmetsp:Transcript_1566/g.1375  ORF Transcript_1566/g.1375 Transcript_1566/m.1375 type:complete len:88 (-) Transcript_1566:899-1162(-)|eukprot:CAMPEP_0114581268 /NCGR_PEP_ID=MMETSP0125-20121206/5400_1 /TAXON_ID=485358 ORGANISM="Aristerostoma sp., Strain ATCC 50986" /NCGR_SAMPLE_ID=MMETSP0125 /ASSEMBLY_ACC=CAM_ASM_000245 /LENGTH=87 /DNA_ID=CAMNT_0001773353 /DNA_START=535 /DNA_END=798 /DNA_ORIENTATION=+
MDDIFEFARDDDEDDDGYDEDIEEDEEELSDSPVPTKESKKKENYLLIQMEYCEGQNLRNIIDSRELDEIRVIKYFKETCEALKYLH